MQKTNQQKTLEVFPPWVSDCSHYIILLDIVAVRIRLQLPIRCHSMIISKKILVIGYILNYNTS